MSFEILKNIKNKKIKSIKDDIVKLTIETTCNEIYVLESKSFKELSFFVIYNSTFIGNSRVVDIQIDGEDVLIFNEEYLGCRIVLKGVENIVSVEKNFEGDEMLLTVEMCDGGRESFHYILKEDEWRISFFNLAQLDSVMKKLVLTNDLPNHPKVRLYTLF